MLCPNWCQICYFFYKNIAFGLTLFYFEAYTGFSGQSVYDDWYMLLFNVILTSLPVISLGVFEQDVSSEICLQVSLFCAYYHNNVPNVVNLSEGVMIATFGNTQNHNSALIHTIHLMLNNSFIQSCCLNKFLFIRLQKETYPAVLNELGCYYTNKLSAKLIYYCWKSVICLLSFFSITCTPDRLK